MMEEHIQRIVIRNFNSIIVDDKNIEYDINNNLIKECISNGFIVSNNVELTNNIVSIIIDELGLSQEQANNTFHKSWKKVSEAPIQQLIIEQLMHYITTYGFEALGVFNSDAVYIPNEKLDLPEITNDIKLSVIKGITSEEVKKKVLSLLYSGVALENNTLDDFLELLKHFDVEATELYKINNNEMKARLYSYLNLIPEDSIEFLRYIIYKITKQSLLIKNPKMIALIKENISDDDYDMFRKYVKTYSIKGLSEIFNRFKPLFLAMKSNDRMKPVINRIKRASYTYHKPMKEDYLNSITKKLKDNVEIEESKLLKELKKVNIFRKIRLLDALTYRENSTDSIVYNIRNGKSFAKEFSFTNIEKLECIKYIVIQSIVEDMKNNVIDKKIFIPENVKYALPCSEKQFVGNVPEGSYVEIDSDLIFGVHWNNLVNKRIDLDLSLIQSNGGKIGWDSSYRTDDRKILFSGDVTDAAGEKGATELFYIKEQYDNELMLFLNYFNYDEDCPVPYTIMLGEEKPSIFKNNYMIDINNIRAKVKDIIEDKQKLIGVIITTKDKAKYHFINRVVGNSITSNNQSYTCYIRNYLVHKAKSKSYINRFLIDAGAEIVTDKEEADIDLSIENLQKDTILKLIIGHK